MRKQYDCIKTYLNYFNVPLGIFFMLLMVSSGKNQESVSETEMVNLRKEEQTPKQFSFRNKRQSEHQNNVRLFWDPVLSDADFFQECDN
jgi:hypothetical protein